ncbi:MAG: hypothetical protein MZV70_17705 [Desulfobacterales bacterium]|nr:hypothetical protein [Desulfobacterales bacterium]
MAANPSSDVDLVIIANDPQKYLSNTEWLSGLWGRHHTEDRGLRQLDLAPRLV